LLFFLESLHPNRLKSRFKRPGRRVVPLDDMEEELVECDVTGRGTVGNGLESGLPQRYLIFEQIEEILQFGLLIVFILM